MGFLVDTYALVEWFVDNNPKYKKYFIRDDLSINPLIFMEFYFSVYHKFGEQKAEISREILLKNCRMIRIKQEDLIKGAKFRSKMYKKKIKMSYTDAICYMLAKKNKLKLLSGDEHFRNLDNVEFVK